MEVAFLAHIHVLQQSISKGALTSVLLPQLLAPALKATFGLTQVTKISKQIINKDNYEFTTLLSGEKMLSSLELE